MKKRKSELPNWLYFTKEEERRINQTPNAASVAVPNFVLGGCMCSFQRRGLCPKCRESRGK